MVYLAEKGNKVYDIDKSQINFYVSQGFDIFENGKILKSGASKTISIEEYNKVVAENKKLKAELKNAKTATKVGE